MARIRKLSILFVSGLALCAGLAVARAPVPAAEAVPGPRFVAVPLSAAREDAYADEVAHVVEDLYAFSYLGTTDSTDSDVDVDAEDATSADLAREIGSHVGATEDGVEALADYGEQLSSAVERLDQASTDLEVTTVSVETRSVEMTRDVANGELLLEAEVLITTEFNDGGPPCEEIIDHLIALDGTGGSITDVTVLDLDTLTAAPDQSLGARISCPKP
jgi:hypothetical protein